MRLGILLAELDRIGGGNAAGRAMEQIAIDRCR